MPRGLDDGRQRVIGRWIRELSVPELAMLLISLSLGDGFRLPIENVPNWYGVSADTAQRGLSGLRDRDLLRVDVRVKTAPLSATGATTEHRYTAMFLPSSMNRRPSPARASTTSSPPPLYSIGPAFATELPESSANAPHRFTTAGKAPKRSNGWRPFLRKRS